MADKEIIQSGRWLTTNHIQAVNKLLRQMLTCQNGLQDTHKLSETGLLSWKFRSNRIHGTQALSLSVLKPLWRDWTPWHFAYHSYCGTKYWQASLLYCLKYELCIDVVGVQMQVGGNEWTTCHIHDVRPLLWNRPLHTIRGARGHESTSSLMLWMTPFPRVAGKLCGRNRIVNSVCFSSSFALMA